MTTRRELREHAFCMLFTGGFYETEEAKQQTDLYVQELSEMNEDDAGEREWKRLPDLSEEERKSLTEKVKAILARVPELDERINAVSTGWKTTRMSRVDLTLIRLALYEMLYDDTVPVKVAINEAVEIAKKYGGADSPSFINGILARLFV